MEVEVLASVMNQTDNSIIEKMNIKTSAIIVNQCKRNNIQDVKNNNKNIKIISLNEKGVGLSRNTALMRATKDIVIFADEDETFVDDYEEIILNEFKNNSKADMIVFNVPSLNKERPSLFINTVKRLRFYNCLKYGTVTFAVKLDKLRKMNLSFSLLFGGGAKYCSGEDSLFIYNFIKNGGKVYTSKQVIGYVSQEVSTWFNNKYDEKYFYDKGALYTNLSKRWCKLMSLAFLLRHKNITNECGLKKAYEYMLNGIEDFLN